MQCEGCKFAEWDRNKVGALHPSGNGRCKWFAQYPLAASCYSRWMHNDGVASFGGGYICRKKGEITPTVTCPVREVAE